MWIFFLLIAILLTPMHAVKGTSFTELRGVADGARSKGCDECGKYITRGIVLANAPGDKKDFVYILLRELGYDPSSLTRWPAVKRGNEKWHGMRW